MKAMPMLVVHGARDGIAPPELSRDAVEAAQKAGMKVSLLEVPDADHISIFGAFPGSAGLFREERETAR